MFLKTFSPDGQPQRIEVQTNINSFVFKFRSRHPRAEITEDLIKDRSVEELVLSRILTALPGLVSITRYSKDGQKNICTNVPMSALMEISAFGKSVVQHDLEEGAESDLFYSTTFFVPLSNAGAVRSDKTEFVVLEYTNPISSVIQSCSVDSIGSYISYPEALIIDTLSAQESQNTAFDCEMNYSLILPKQTSKVRLDSKAGDSLELRKDDLSNLQLFTTDFIHNVEGRMFRSLNWNAVDVGQAYRGELLFEEKSSYYMLRNTVL